MLPTRPPIMRSILETRCPKCRLGEIFRDSIFKVYRLRLPRMNERCPVCDFKFMREPGYFLGAMYISYGLGLFLIILIGTALWLATKWWITTVTIWAVIIFLPLGPGISMFARCGCIWIGRLIRNRFHYIVILSAVVVSRSETTTESKDPMPAGSQDGHIKEFSYRQHGENSLRRPF